jgi:hypothetical protein
MLKKHPVISHIKAAKRIIKGDEELLNTMFFSDEFGILTEFFPTRSIFN